MAVVAAILGFANAAPAFAQERAIPSTSGATAIPDPWGGANRKLYGFNHAVDHAVIAPVIHAYMAVTPAVFRRGLSRAVDNLDEPRIALNDLLQGRLVRGGTAVGRFALNSSFGLAGLVDVASTSGLPRHESDFGQTLGRYGVGTGPYVFVPIAGPSDVRDGAGRIVDAFADPLTILFGGLGASIFGDVRSGAVVIDARTEVDGEMRALDRDFTDPYTTVKSAYSQNRAYMVANARGEAARAVQDLPDFGSEPPGPSRAPSP